VPIDGVGLVRTRHVVTRSGYTTEIYRNDWPQTGTDARHVMTNRWESPFTTEWHCHRKQTDNITVLLGRMLIGLYDDRDGSASRGKTMVVRCDWVDPLTVVIPPGIYHAFRVLVAPTLMLNTVTHAYDYADPDNWRVAGEAQVPLDLSKLE
jgi:dTDP-4-dehydrorhamnose 3,5-epimerase